MRPSPFGRPAPPHPSGARAPLKKPPSAALGNKESNRPSGSGIETVTGQWMYRCLPLTEPFQKGLPRAFKAKGDETAPRRHHNPARLCPPHPADQAAGLSETALRSRRVRAGRLGCLRNRRGTWSQRRCRRRRAWGGSGGLVVHAKDEKARRFTRISILTLRQRTAAVMARCVLLKVGDLAARTGKGRGRRPVANVR